MHAKQRVRQLASICLFILLLALSVGAACEVAFRIYKGQWYFQMRRASGVRMVQLHPYFGACNVPNASEERNGVRITINSKRTRGAEFVSPKPPGIKRVVALGGSSTYCVGVSDDQTWEHHLDGMLGANWEVINMGAPGGTSVETMIQSALLFSDVQPDIAIFYLGWNDARVQHVKDLLPDYSDFHGKWVTSQGLSGRTMRSRTAAGYLLDRFAFQHFFPKLDPEDVYRGAQGTDDAFSDRVDLRAMSLYERNLGLIVALCRKQGVEPVFVPQILNYEELKAETSYGWMPFVRDCDLKTIMAAYNQTMANVAQRDGVPFLREVLEVEYEPDDFIDNGHFSDKGNRRFAVALSAGLERVRAITTNAVSVQ